MILTKEDEQAHADCQDGAGAEGGQPVTFDLPQLTALTPEALLTPAPVAVGRQRLAHSTVTAGSGSAGRRHATLLTRVLRHGHLTAGTPGRPRRGSDDVRVHVHVRGVGCVVYLHWCFLHRSTQRSGPRHGWLLQASLEQPGTRPRLSRTATRSRLCPSRGRT